MNIQPITVTRKVDVNGHIRINDMFIHISSFVPGQNVHITIGANPSQPRCMSTVECLGQMVEQRISAALARDDAQYAERLHEWQRMDGSMELLVIRLAHAISQGYQSEETPANRYTSPARKLYSRYLQLQSSEPATPAEEILRRMLKEADA